MSQCTVMPFASASWRSRRIVLRLRAFSAPRNRRSVRKAVILPMKLLIVALQISEPAEQAVFGSVANVTWTPEAPESPHNSIRPRPSARGRRRIGSVTDQEPAAGRRRERHRHLEFGIVAAAGALIGVGPAAIEDVFAARMALEIARRRGDQRAVGRLASTCCGCQPVRPPTDFEASKADRKSCDKKGL